MSTCVLWTIRNSDARALGFSIVHKRQVDASVGLLKEPQKSSIQFLERHVDLCIVDNTELRRARASELSIVHNTQVDASVGLLKDPQKISNVFLEWHVDLCIVDNTELRDARARARWSSLLSTIDKSTRPSASFKSHRNLNSVFRKACRLVYCGQYRTPTRARVGVLYCPQ